MSIEPVAFKAPAPQPQTTPETGLRQTNPGVGTPTKEAEGIAPTTKEPLISKEYAAMARKEQALRKRDLELKAREDALNTQSKTYESSYVPKAKIAEMLQTNPEALGLSWDQITQLVLNQPKPEEIALQKLQSKIQSLEENQNQAKTLIEQQEQRAYQQAVTQIRQEAKRLVENDAAYETIRAEGAEEAIVELIEQTYKDSGQLLETKDAAEQVENFLLERAIKLASLEKVKAKLAPPPPVEPEAPVQYTQSRSHYGTTPVAKVSPQQTLTNVMSATSRPPTSERERRERAIAAFQGRLNS